MHLQERGGESRLALEPGTAAPVTWDSPLSSLSLSLLIEKWAEHACSLQCREASSHRPSCPRMGLAPAGHSERSSRWSVTACKAHWEVTVKSVNSVFTAGRGQGVYLPFFRFCLVLLSVGVSSWPEGSSLDLCTFPVACLLQ